MSPTAAAFFDRSVCMPLPPLFRRLSLRRAGAAAADPLTAPSVSPPSEEAHALLRTRARHRLIGATALVAAAVVGLPLLFEGQPRPVPSDLPIELPGREADEAPAAALPPAATPPAATVPVPVPAPRTEPLPAEARPPELAASGAPGASGVEAEAGQRRSTALVPVERPAPPPRAAGPARTPPAPAAALADAARAKALLDGKPAAAVAAPLPAAPPSAGVAGLRFIVQVGAYADGDAVGAARSKAERLGMKTYTQVVQTPAGARTRVRVGPYANHGDADRALAQLRSAGLPGVVLTLGN